MTEHETEREGGLSALVDRLRQERDELKLKARLGAAEVKEEWEELEEKWEGLKSRLGEIGEAAGEATDDVKAAVRMLADELKEGYAKIRSRF